MSTLSGIGDPSAYVMGYGDADSWGGPQNGIDVINHLGDNVVTSKGSRVSSDTYMFLMIVGAVTVLWFLGGIIFKDVRF